MHGAIGMEVGDVVVLSGPVPWGKHELWAVRCSTCGQRFGLTDRALAEGGRCRFTKQHPAPPPPPSYWFAKYVLRARIQRQVTAAIKSGELVRLGCCERCGAGGKIVGHHEDYTRPLDLMWLCTGCHGRRHAELAEAGVDPWSKVPLASLEEMFRYEAWWREVDSKRHRNMPPLPSFAWHRGSRRRVRAALRCSACRSTGHNRRRCPVVKEAA